MSTSLKSLRSAAIGTSAVAIGGYVAASVTTGVVVTGLVLSNRTASSVQVNVQIIPGGGGDTQIATYLAQGTTILPGGTIVLADEGNRVTLNAGNQIQVLSTAAGSVDATMSVAEIT